MARKRAQRLCDFDDLLRLDDRHSYAPLSRFLSPAVRSLMNTEHAEPTAGELAVTSNGAGGEDGVAAVDRFLAELWS